MQENVLEANPEVDLEVYVVWEPILGERRSHAVGAVDLLTDRRVRHYWNDAFIAGEEFKDHDPGSTAWDIYFFMGWRRPGRQNRSRS